MHGLVVDTMDLLETGKPNQHAATIVTILILFAQFSWYFFFFFHLAVVSISSVRTPSKRCNRSKYAPFRPLKLLDGAHMNCSLYSVRDLMDVGSLLGTMREYTKLQKGHLP